MTSVTKAIATAVAALPADASKFAVELMKKRVVFEQRVGEYADCVRSVDAAAKACKDLKKSKDKGVKRKAEAVLEDRTAQLHGLENPRIRIRIGKRRILVADCNGQLGVHTRSSDLDRVSADVVRDARENVEHLIKNPCPTVPEPTEAEAATLLKFLGSDAARSRYFSKNDRAMEYYNDKDAVRGAASAFKRITGKCLPDFESDCSDEDESESESSDEDAPVEKDKPAATTAASAS